LSADHGDDRTGQFQRSPTGPRVGPPREPTKPQPTPPRRFAGSRRNLWSVLFVVLVIGSVGVRAVRDLARPEAWVYWKDLYVAPSLTASPLMTADFGGAAQGRRALAISGKIGAASASWFRARLDEAHLAAGDIILVSSPGGDLGQALIMGEMIRSRGLQTAVGQLEASGKVKPSYCASACVFVYAGGKSRLGVDGSVLGVHRFVTSGGGDDPVAETQRTTGMVLGYVTKMGVSPALVEAMSQTREVRWLNTREAMAMNLVTGPVGQP